MLILMKIFGALRLTPNAPYLLIKRAIRPNLIKYWTFIKI